MLHFDQIHREQAMNIKRMVLILTLLALLSGGCSTVTIKIDPAAKAIVQPANATALPDAVSFATPEAAITAYLDGVAGNNVEKILQAAAVNEMAAGFHIDRQVERLGGVLNPFMDLAPSDYPFYVDMNKVQLASRILNQVKAFTYSLLSDVKVDGTLVLNVNADAVATLTKAMDPQRLAGIKVERIDIPAKTLMNDPKYISNATKSAAVYGADESTERVALFSFEGNDYVVGFTLLRYGDTWKVSNQSSPIAGTSVFGTATKTTVDDYQNLIGSN
jgi:hypothetical protein